MLRAAARFLAAEAAAPAEAPRRRHADEDEGELAAWFTTGAARKDLVLYLETFTHTVGVMQTKDALIRVAQECAEDLAADLRERMNAEPELDPDALFEHVYVEPTATLRSQRQFLRAERELS